MSVIGKHRPGTAHVHEPTCALPALLHFQRCGVLQQPEGDLLEVPQRHARHVPQAVVERGQARHADALGVVRLQDGEQLPVPDGDAQQLLRPCAAGAAGL